MNPLIFGLLAISLLGTGVVIGWALKEDRDEDKGP